MPVENVVIFIKLDSEILNNPNIFKVEEHKQIVDTPLPANMLDNLQYNYNLENVEYDTKLKQPENQDKPQKISGNFSNVYIQLEQCNNNLEWATSTNLYCKNCWHQFDTRPWYLPIHYIDGVFIVKPIFCSSGCALRYNLDSGHYDYSKRQSLFYLMYNKIYNKQVTKLPIAPPIVMLNIHGGPYHIEEYRDMSEMETDDEVRVEIPEIYSVIPKIQLIKRKQENNNEQYKLKRNKPIVRKNKSVLDTIVTKL